jgi:hypothetical protein
VQFLHQSKLLASNFDWWKILVPWRSKRHLNPDFGHMQNRFGRQQMADPLIADPFEQSAV